MNIHGLQKMTLLDYPEHVACTVFLAGCNFRCPFCHNAELCDINAPDPVIDDSALLSFLVKRKGLLEGVVFTGGEPLMQPQLPDLIRKVKDLGYPVKLDTDGYWPERLRPLLEEKLIDYLAMDIKNSPDRYAETCGVQKTDMNRIEESIRLIMNSGVDYEFRTTVVHPLHDETSFPAMGAMIRGAKRYFLQAFTDRDTVVYSGFSAADSETMHHYADLIRPYVQSVSLRGI